MAGGLEHGTINDEEWIPKNGDYEHKIKEQRGGLAI